MQLKEYTAAEAVYRKAQVVELDANKACNLCTCLSKQGKVDEARSILFRDVLQENKEGFDDDSRLKVRVQELLSELDVVTSVSVMGPTFKEYDCECNVLCVGLVQKKKVRPLFSFCGNLTLQFVSMIIVSFPDSYLSLKWVCGIACL